MNVNKLFGLVTLAISLVTSSAFAHHHEMGSVGALQDEALELQQAVQYSALSYNVKNAVYYFVNSVNQLNYCVPPDQNSEGSWHHHDIPPQCQGYAQQVRSSFYQVDYYLSDAYDYPQVYQAYQEARQALYALGT